MIPLAKKRVSEIIIQWRPQPRQATFLQACGVLGILDGLPPVPPLARVIGYGGAAGGGKSDALLGVALAAGLYWRGINIGYFRREYPMLEGPGGAIIRSHELMSGWAQWKGDNLRWIYPTGSLLEFCHAKNELDVHKYQSQQFDIILIDEATQFTRYQYRYLLTRNRATKAGVIPFMALATNPGNEGHAWFKAEFADQPPEKVQDVEVEPGYREKHIFIPARLSDNLILEQRDPGYRATLEAQSEMVRRQLLEGDWSAFAGQYFASWRPEIHVISTPKDFRGWLKATRNHKKFRCLDYGLDTTACYWIDISPSGRLTVYREIYKPNLILSKAARSILEATTDLEQISYTVASPDLWNRRQDTGKSGLEILMESGLRGLVKADNRRVPGWEHMAEWIEPYDDPETGKPAANLVFFDCCRNATQQIPNLIRDDNDPNDVSDKIEDHAGEAIRYGLMSRPKPRIKHVSKLAEIEEKFGPDSAEVVIYRKHCKDPRRKGVTLARLGM